MADDGLLLNFAVNDSVAAGPQKFKGGSWRERLQAKRTAQRGGQRRQGGVNGLPITGRRLDSSAGLSKNQIEDFPDDRPQKRRRENGYTPGLDDVAGHAPQRDRRNEQKPSTGPREVISSLFSYNPKPVTANEDQKKEDADEKAAAPTNAPLPDGIDTFTSLGLSPTLAAHLLTKMNLKNPTAIQKSAVSQLLKEDSDAFIQSETGSGKTLAYLLPVVQRIFTMAELRRSETKTAQDPAVHRDSGLFAIVLAPTRELCKQISVVLERLLGCAHYIVAGTVIGGEKKKSEKARLRKGLNILVATPGRLVDHLENTKSLDVSNVRWLVLDEGDRLVDLGFEEDITKIVKTLDQKQRKSSRPGLPEKRTTVLCSATLKMNVQKLGEISLKDAILIKGDASNDEDETTATTNGIQSAFLAPAQLKQSYLVTAAKLRLVTLTALLKRTFARKGSVMKAIVFISCADSVEFHYKVLTRALEEQAEDKPTTKDTSDSDAEEKGPTSKPQPTKEAESDSIAPSPILSSQNNQVTLYKLHGSLPQATRTNIVRHFASTTTPSLLIATDVASRGLDLPNLDLVIEYDPAFSSDDHLHRIGRTARLGRDGRATIFLMPGKEEGYVDVLKSSYKSSDSVTSSNVSHMAADEVLKKGFSPATGVIATKNSAEQKDWNWESRATAFQLDVERWVLADPTTKELAKRAFQSHVRAYATHVAAERKWFDIKDLHLGHLAKAFGLRDPPGRVNVVGTGRRGQSQGGAGGKRIRSGGDETHEAGAGGDVDDAAKKMKEKVRNRKMMMGGGADEFNIA
ncbi:ATP dependent RNA helicase [Exophiala viscosa]|uniref:ATP-dependent RNA helicase n=1 Tax=Exophiala viscosa TaxID=2486360 RepID=A0AAN6IH16_9EURO|nr:ATP dependent RNA helicase [Exophiala viscosa]KAI1624035.1 ATP dependent RNA helicase [Exophiala viscosa]